MRSGILKTARKNNIKIKITYIFIAVFGLFLSTLSLGCENTKLTELENIYCQLKPKNTTLPSFHQFRKNSEATQYLLLKSPAKKAGMQLPPRSTYIKSQPANIQKKPNKTRSPSSPTNKKILSTRPMEDNRSSSSSHLLEGCRIDQSVIICESSRFIFQKNKPKDQLALTVFSNRNQLIVGAFKDNAGQNLNRYLADAYTQYVEKVVGLGLAEAVMSYTKFVVQYRHVKASGKDFSNRLQRMFEVLKQEKKTRPNQVLGNKALPQNLEQCVKLTSYIIICDDVHNAWVFTQLAQ